LAPGALSSVLALEIKERAARPRFERMVLDQIPPQPARKIGVTNANNLYRLG
jgi:hypothetical protein